MEKINLVFKNYQPHAKQGADSLLITTPKSQPYGVLYNFIFELNMIYPAYRRASQPAVWQ
jgi:hypothetical protein